MIAPSLYADLVSRGVELSIAKTPDIKDSPEIPPLRLHIRAPEGALDEAMRAAIHRHRDELLQFVFELEEAAAILQIMQGNRIEDAQRLAREYVIGGNASPDGRLWLTDYAEHHPKVLAAQDACRKVFNCELEIMDVGRIEAA